MMSVARGVAGALIVLLLTPSPCRPQEPRTLSLATAVAAARRHHPQIAAAKLAAEAAGHRARQAGRWSNPEITAYQENFPGADPDADQWIVNLSQRVRIGGQLGLATDAAETEAAALREEAVATRAEILLQVRSVYVDAYAAQRRSAALDEALETARDLLDDLEARRAEGDVSVFDVRRLRLEVESLGIQEADARAQLRDACIRIAALTGLAIPEGLWRFDPPEAQPGGPPAPGEEESGDGLATLPGDAPERTELDVGTDAARAEVRAAARRRDAAGIRRELARREVVPDLVVTAGYSRLDPGLDGMVWSVNAVLPLFDRNRDEAAAVAAEQARLERQAEALALATRGQRRRALDAYRAATAALQELEGPGDADLVGVARVAYEEGEMSVAELLDAVQAELSAGMRRIDLEHRRTRQWFRWKWAAGAGEEVTR